MSGCLFCDIVRGHAASYPVYQDDQVYAFLDLFPVSPGHTLVIPKRHADDLFGTTEACAEAVARTVRLVALALREVLDPDGVTVTQLNGVAAGQTVFHSHTHLIPRALGAPKVTHTGVRGRPRELEEMASRLSAALGG